MQGVLGTNLDCILKQSYLSPLWILNPARNPKARHPAPPEQKKAYTCVWAPSHLQHGTARPTDYATKMLPAGQEEASEWWTRDAADGHSENSLCWGLGPGTSVCYVRVLSPGPRKSVACSKTNHKQWQTFLHEYSYLRPRLSASLVSLCSSTDTGYL